MMKLIAFDMEMGRCIYIRIPKDYGIVISDSGEASPPVKWLSENEAASLQKINDHPFVMIATNPGGNLQNAVPDVDLGASVRVFSLSRNEADHIGGDDKEKSGNMSVVTVVDYKSSEGYAWKVVVAGDNFSSGWEALLAKPDFREAIKDTDFLVTSLYGQKPGFNKNLFEAMGKPIGIISTTFVGSEPPDSRYEKFAQGVAFPEKVFRKHFNTRDDGNITVEMKDDGRYDVWLYNP